jgi:hypothetical protein
MSEEELYTKAVSTNKKKVPEQVTPYCPFIRAPCNHQCMAWFNDCCVIVDFFMRKRDIG